MGSAGAAFLQQAFDRIDEMDRLTTEDAVRDSLGSLLGEVGFEHFTILRLPSIQETIAPHMLLKRWPDRWLDHYDANNLLRLDPVAKRCLSSLKPFVWSELTVEAGSPSERVMLAARDHRLCDGLTIPLVDADGFSGAVSMAGELVDLPPSSRRAIHLVSLYAFGIAERLHQRGPKRPGATLTGREREVLCWSANGKTAWEISEILGIAERTVIAHLVNARAKLGTFNTTHAVVEALRRRELRL